MTNDKLKIGFVRRGFSRSGGAESYLKRLAQGVVQEGHQVELFTTREWPANEWVFGPITRLGNVAPIAFADQLERLRVRSSCDVLMSLERVWRCDVFRAGDGVHQVWLQQRARYANAWTRWTARFHRKHAEILRLEEALFRNQTVPRIIANSEMVKKEIVRTYGFPAERIDVVYNGVPIGAFESGPEERTKFRHALGLAPGDIALLFVGSGWARKGLRYAIEAVEQCGKASARLLVAGRGNERKYRSPAVQFLGVVPDPASVFQAADIFLLPTIYDPFSNACLEALAAGLPIITTRANGFSEIITEQVHGSVIAECTDLAAIKRAIQFWSDPPRRAEARPLIRTRATQFDISKNVARTLEILFQAVANAVSVSGKIRKT